MKELRWLREEPKSHAPKVPLYRVLPSTLTLRDLYSRVTRLMTHTES